MLISEPLPNALTVVELDPATLIPDPENARKHTKRQLVQLTAAIREFGFTNPILIDERDGVIAGHARREAALAVGLKAVRCIRISRLSATQRKALAVSDNRLGDLSSFDPVRLSEQLAELTKLNFSVEVMGFNTAEIDIMMDARHSMPASAIDSVEELDRTILPISRPGDLWQVGEHRLICGSALEPSSYQHLLGGDQAAMVITDPPYNVPISGHVSGLGRVQHEDFAMASGEMSPEAFMDFLSSYMTLCVQHSADGSIHYHFMDWGHLREILSAGTAVYGALKALCVWNKTNGGMGSLYRSKHELVLVYKNGTAKHVNNVELGKHGRYRTNVWDYAGANTFRAGRDADLADHPTVKPVALIADAIRDCSRRGDIVLDPFAGSGTILLAAQRTGRRAAAIEIDPHYVDVAIRRWENRTGEPAKHAASGESFLAIAEARSNTEAARG